MKKPNPPKVEYLGTVIGSQPYLGQCPKCGRQFLSTHDRVVRSSSGQILCEKCGAKANPPAVQIYKPTRGVVIQGMQKPPGHPCDARCAAANHKYRHVFKEPIEIIGLPDGNVLLRSRRGKR